MVGTRDSDRLSGFGRGLRLLREAAGLTQGEVATRTDHTVRKSQISAYENERARPSLESLAALLQALGADFAELQRAIELARNDQATPGRLEAAVELRKDLRAGVGSTGEELPGFLVLDLRRIRRDDPDRVALAVKDYVNLSRTILRGVERDESTGSPSKDQAKQGRSGG